MLIYIGSDHRGFELKEFIKNHLKEGGYEVVDCGPETFTPDDDYPQYAAKVGQGVSKEPDQSRGIVVCGSGVGVNVVANKYPHVRASFGFNSDQVFAGRNDDDMNVLVLASDFVGEGEVKKMISVFIQTPFSGDERHKRRLKEIEFLEQHL